MSPSFHKPAGSPPPSTRPAFAPPDGTATPDKPKRKKGTSPTARCLAELRELGFTAQVVERWSVYARKTIDLFGCIDIVAARAGSGIYGIQACAGASHAARRTKSIDEPRLRAWLESGGRFEIWSWTKAGKKDTRKLWTLRREEVTLADIGADAKAGLFAGAPA